MRSGEPFAATTKRLVAKLQTGQAEGARPVAIPPTLECSGSARAITRIDDRRRRTIPKVRDAIRLIEKNGWALVRTRGSHRQYRHPHKPGTVTIAGNPGDDFPRGTWASVMKQAGLKE